MYIPFAVVMLEEKEINKGYNIQEARQQFAVDLAVKAMDTYTVERDIARHIKNKFDETYGPNWHCIVGKNFGRYVQEHHFNNFRYISDAYIR